MSLESFKSFVRERPKLMDFVANKTMSWQDFYNMYELYGPNNDVWSKYLTTTATTSTKVSDVTASFKDIFNSFKNMNMNDVQKGINSLQKGIKYIKDIVDTKTGPEQLRKTTYEPRQIYKYFDD